MLASAGRHFYCSDGNVTCVQGDRGSVAEPGAGEGRGPAAGGRGGGHRPRGHAAAGGPGRDLLPAPPPQDHILQVVRK